MTAFLEVWRPAGADLVPLGGDRIRVAVCDQMAQPFHRKAHSLSVVTRTEPCGNLELAKAFVRKPRKALCSGHDHPCEGETRVALERFVQLFNRRPEASRDRKDITGGQVAPRILWIEID